MTVHLLRRFEARHAEQSIPLSPAGQRLVAFLALNKGPLTRVYVAGTLWIDYRQEAANANLRTALWRLSRLSCQLIDATLTHLSLAADVVVDVHETLAIAKRAGVNGGDCSEWELERLMAAGELLPDWYDDWTVFERERFRQLRLHALERLCEQLRRQGRLDRALEVGLAAVASEPLRESAHRAVMRVHLAEGNAAEAFHQYDLFRGLLQSRLGVLPSDEMELLLQRCARRDDAVTATR
jgi:DNA-binding SARP family transcriptional activator